VPVAGEPLSGGLLRALIEDTTRNTDGGEEGYGGQTHEVSGTVRDGPRCRTKPRVWGGAIIYDTACEVTCEENPCPCTANGGR
jgi:hypothetical protein